MRKEFTKKDLKDGMVVEYKDEHRRLVVDNMLIGQDGWLDLRSINYDLKHSGNDCEFLDIVKVYKIKRPRDFRTLLDDDNLELIWQRTETKHMTTEEMRQKLEELTGEKTEVDPSEEEMIGACYKYCSNSVSGECKKDCVLYGTGDCHFEDYLRDELKQCYEKVMEDEKAKSNE